LLDANKIILNKLLKKICNNPSGTEKALLSLACIIRKKGPYRQTKYTFKLIE